MGSQCTTWYRWDGIDIEEVTHNSNFAHTEGRHACDSGHKTRLCVLYTIVWCQLWCGVMATKYCPASGSSPERSPDTSIALPILKTFQTYSYRIPSFPTLTVHLQHMRCQMAHKNGVHVYHGYTCECPSLDRVYPALASTAGYPDAFFIAVCVCVYMHLHCVREKYVVYLMVNVKLTVNNVIFLHESEFSQCLGVSSLVLNEHEILVVWKWTWDYNSPSDEAEISQSELEDRDISEGLSSDTESDGQTHSLVFKCIGSTKDTLYQENLSRAAQVCDKRDSTHSSASRTRESSGFKSHCI